MTTAPVVRSGEDWYYRPRSHHTVAVVYAEMLRQVCRDYAGLPDVRTLTLREIRFFYEGIRPELKEHTKPRS